MAKNTYFISIHIGKFISAHFEQFYVSTFFPKNLKILPNLSQMVPKGPQTIPKRVQKIPKNTRKMSEKCPKNVRKVSKKCPKSVRKISKKCPKHLQNSSKKSQKYGKKSLSVVPRIEPGTLRIPLQHLSEDQPIGLIPSQQRGSPEISYVSK